jgi:hypothetical protein
VLPIADAICLLVRAAGAIVVARRSICHFLHGMRARGLTT